MKKKNQNKKDCCFCPKMMRLNELKDIKIQMVVYQLKNIIESIEIENIENDYPKIEF